MRVKKGAWSCEYIEVVRITARTCDLSPKAHDFYCGTDNFVELCKGRYDNKIYLVSCGDKEVMAEGLNEINECLEAIYDEICEEEEDEEED